MYITVSTTVNLFLVKQNALGGDSIQMYADLEGHKINGQTIPPNIEIVMTSSLPDLVILDSSSVVPTDGLF